MAAALLKSAMMKFANSGELITPDTSLTSVSGSGDIPVTSDNSSVPVATTEAPKTTGFTFGATPPATTTADKTDAAQTASLFKFGASDATDVTSTAASAVVVAPTATTQSSQPPAQPAGFTLAGFPKPANGLFKFGIDAATNEDTSKNEPKPADAVPVSKPNFNFGASKPGGFSFGATTSATTVPVASVAPSTVASTSSGFTLGQSTQPVSTAATMFGQSLAQPTTSAPMFGLGPKPTVTLAPIKFGQTQPASTAASTQGQTEATITFGAAPKPSTIVFGQSPQTPAGSFGQTSTTPSGFNLGSATAATTQSATSSKPGGFSFTPSTSFSMGSSPTSITASISLAPIFSFGSSGKQQDGAKTNLFGMPTSPAPSAPTTTTSEPAKSFGGFNFTPSAAKESPKALFPSAAPQNPEQKKTEGM